MDKQEVIYHSIQVTLLRKMDKPHKLDALNRFESLLIMRKILMVIPLFIGE